MATMIWKIKWFKAQKSRRRGEHKIPPLCLLQRHYFLVNTNEQILKEFETVLIVYHENHSRVKSWLLFGNLQSLILLSRIQNDASTMRDRTAGTKRFKKLQIKTKTKKKHVKSELLNIHFDWRSLQCFLCGADGSGTQGKQSNNIWIVTATQP